LKIPSFFFVAHCRVAYHTTGRQMANLKKLAPNAHVEAFTSSSDPLHVTFVATMTEPVDFLDLGRKFTYYFGGKSKILSTHSSTTTKPDYFYSAHLIQNFPLSQRNHGFVATPPRWFRRLCLLPLAHLSFRSSRQHRLGRVS
jgi:hypothetical protein